PSLNLTDIDWAIVGGESGRQARPMHPDWARSLRDQCVGAGVAFHFKQWGDWGPGYGENLPARRQMEIAQDGTEMFKLGKTEAGRLLDGSVHDGLPAIRRFG
ncbi:MAG: DUF5131 family protein, partial [Oscillospiraceae bacterium]|nr:DUF5131 family protein [Oscillospiraceae bacterium]